MANSQNVQINHSPGATLQDVRLTATDGTAAPEESRPHIRVVFFAANPEGTAPIRLDQEVKAITEALRSSPAGDRFDFQQSWAAGERELQDGLLRYRPEIVHISGHGTPGGRICLDRSSSSREWGISGAVSTSQDESLWLLGLARVFEAVRGQVRCIVLNACHSETAAQVLAQLAGCVIGMSDAIEDDAAIRFSWAFYNALGHGRSVKAAFDLATAQVLFEATQRAEVPRLVTIGIDPSAIVFV